MDSSQPVTRPCVWHESITSRKLPDDIWKQVDYFYRHRCKLVHERAHSGIDDSEIEAQIKMVATILSTAFSITIDTKSI